MSDQAKDLSAENKDIYNLNKELEGILGRVGGACIRLQDIYTALYGSEPAPEKLTAELSSAGAYYCAIGIIEQTKRDLTELEDAIVGLERLA